MGLVKGLILGFIGALVLVAPSMSLAQALKWGLGL